MTGKRGDAEPEESGSYASPPCFLHELDPAYSGLAPEPDRQQRLDVMRWRKAERARLIAVRLAMDVRERTAAAARIAAALDALLGDLSGLVISAYWPIRGEPDLRPWCDSVRARGGIVALPVAARPAAPLTFRVWAAAAPLAPGIWNIPVPAEGALVEPDIVLAPVVGFDRGCYRLGHGGGYFDRTLAATPAGKTRRAIGVGYARTEIATIFPQPYDIPLDAIVTENETIRPPHRDAAEAGR